jgi:ABC-type transport system substrate-binding protein
MKMKTVKVIIALLISLSILSSNIAFVHCCDSPRTLAFLTLKTEYGKHHDYALHITKYLKSIGIKTRIHVLVEGSYDILLNPNNDFDLAIIEIENNLNCTDGDILKIYSEEGILGNFGWSREIPYCEESEELLTEYKHSDNDEEKLDYLSDWMVMIMDKILPVLPLFVPKDKNSIIFLAFNLRKPFVGGADNFVFLCSPGKEPYTKGVTVRKIIAYCIDKEEINNIVNKGLYNITPYPVIDNTGEVLESAVDFEIQYYRDLEIAREWLNAASCQPTPTPNYSGNHLDLLLIVVGVFLIGPFVLKKRRRKEISA